MHCDPHESNDIGLRVTVDPLAFATVAEQAGMGIQHLYSNGNQQRQTIRVVVDYREQSGGAGNNSNVEFAEAGDLNGDGIADFLMVYPDGRVQNLYVLAWINPLE
ncbi:MAG: hypothetical protein MRY76_00400 [Pseudomonadales bacterium]|nr:hypothetical protein [Pseudomonadales bacterium]